MLPGLTLLAAQTGSGLAATVERLVYSVTQVAVPVLRALGILVIIWGVLLAAFRFFRMEGRRLARKRYVRNEYRRDAIMTREHLVYHLLMGLDFLIAVDVIESLMHPDWNELGFLAALVGLRTLLSVSLAWELKDTQEEEQKMQQATTTTDTPAGSS